MTKRHLLIPAFATLAAALVTHAAESAPVAWWALDGLAEDVALDRAGGVRDRIDGSFTRVAGVREGAVRFDGYTTEITRAAGKSPALSGGFAVEGSVALGAYPWNWCALVTQRDAEKSGFSVDLGPRGQFRMQLNVGGEWRRCESGDFVVELRKWTHLAASFDPKSGIVLFVNGAKAGELSVTGEPAFAPDADLKIGANHAPGKPSNIHRDYGTLGSWFSLDGIVDEVKIYNQLLKTGQVAVAFAANKAKADPDLPLRRLPSGPAGSGRFGACYAHLNYYPEWDALWPVGQDPDVVVRFDTSPARLVFWRGTRYSPAWVSGNEMWMTDQSVESWDETEGCFEHMQDRRCRYSHVRIIENHAARTVVHWRYAPVSAHNKLLRENEKTTRACWVDEYYYIYPDAAGIRNVSWKSGTLGGPRQFQESMPLTHPGQLQRDVIEPAWVTVANYAGESGLLYHKENPAKTRADLPGDLTIQRYNLKSKQKPFICFEPGNKMGYLKDRDIRNLDGPGSCNHWPVGQAICDGRTSQAADRPTSFLGFPISDPPVYDNGEREGWFGFYGMTGKNIDELVRLGRSWAQAAPLKLAGRGLAGGEYDRGQRAWVFQRKSGGGEITFELAASKESPVINPAFVIENWGDGTAEIEVDGKLLQRGPNRRIGRREHLDGADLIVWLKHDTEKPLQIRLIPDS